MAYKVVETSTVTDETIERILNEWTAKGYSFQSIHFVTSESSRRPAMAFLFFMEVAVSDKGEGGMSASGTSA